LVQHYEILEEKGSISEFAASSAATDALVRVGLNWWAARGQIERLEQDNTLVLHSVKNLPDKAQMRLCEEQIIQLIEEISAYQAYYRKADASLLINAETLSHPGKKK